MPAPGNMGGPPIMETEVEREPLNKMEESETTEPDGITTEVIKALEEYVHELGYMS